jgi:hypothetical protein
MAIDANGLLMDLITADAMRLLIEINRGSTIKEHVDIAIVPNSVVRLPQFGDGEIRAVLAVTAHVEVYAARAIDFVKKPSPQICEEHVTLIAGAVKMLNVLCDHNSREALRVFSPFTNSLKGIAEDVYWERANPSFWENAYSENRQVNTGMADEFH